MLRTFQDHVALEDREGKDHRVVKTLAGIKIMKMTNTGSDPGDIQDVRAHNVIRGVLDLEYPFGFETQKNAFQDAEDRQDVQDVHV